MAEHSEGEPPDLSITLPRMSDIDETLKEWAYIVNIVLPIDVLLLTAKECEFLSCYWYLQNSFQSYLRGLGYVFFGHMGKTENVKVKVALIRCYEGATDPRGSLITVKNAVMELKPKAVFCVGFAGALNYEKVKLGDVVVSSKLTTYAHKKTTNDQIQPRGFTAPVSRNISDLIIHSAVGWKAPLKNPEVRNVKVHCDGEFLSGPELVNSGWRREELVTLYPNAIAVEMEGEGVFAAAFDLEMEWVVIKGISDYADGTKGATAKWRPFASTMAASVVANILKNPVVFQNWHNYSQDNSRACTRTSSEGLFPSAIVSNPRPGNLGDLLGSLFQTLSPTSGQIQYKGRTIKYSVQGRMHSIEDPWVFDGMAWDVESGISKKVRHCQDGEDAKKEAFNELVAELEKRGILKN